MVTKGISPRIRELERGIFLAQTDPSVLYMFNFEVADGMEPDSIYSGREK